MTKKENKQEPIVINVKKIKDKLLTIIDAGYLCEVDEWYAKLMQALVESYRQHNGNKKEVRTELESKFGKSDLLNDIIKFYDSPYIYVSDTYVEIEEVGTDGSFKGFALVKFNTDKDGMYEIHLDSTVEHLNYVYELCKLDNE